MCFPLETVYKTYFTCHLVKKESMLLHIYLVPLKKVTLISLRLILMGYQAVHFFKSLKRAWYFVFIVTFSFHEVMQGIFWCENVSDHHSPYHRCWYGYQFRYLHHHRRCRYHHHHRHYHYWCFFSCFSCHTFEVHKLLFSEYTVIEFFFN